MMYSMYSGTYKDLTVAVKKMNKTLSKEDKILLKADIAKHDNIVICHHIVRLLLKQYNICCCIILGNRS